MIRTRHFALQAGYNGIHDTRHGFVLGLGERQRSTRAVPRDCSPRYRFIVTVAWDWPQPIWADENWALNAPGYVRGLPIWRDGIASSTWTGRKYTLFGWRWSRSFSWVRYEDVS